MTLVFSESVGIPVKLAVPAILECLGPAGIRDRYFHTCMVENALVGADFLPLLSSVVSLTNQREKGKVTEVSLTG